MEPNLVIWAQLAHVTHTLILIGWMGYVRVHAVKSGEVSLKQVRETGWPGRIGQISANANHQYEAPVLFHVLALLALVTANAGLLMGLLAWGFVLSRVAHSFIHTGKNYIPARFIVFVVGLGFILLMLILLVFNLSVGRPA